MTKNERIGFRLDDAYQLLERTPATIRSLLKGLPDEWVQNNEGGESFSPYDVLGHLIQGEKTDWPDRILLILEKGTAQPFEPYARFAMYTDSLGKTLDQLLDEFAELRKQKVEWLKSLNLQESDLERKGMHPQFGEVTMRQLIATWVVHDLTHTSQITRVMAKQYKEAVGPWSEFFRLLNF